jgi:hypothetical protein
MSADPRPPPTVEYWAISLFSSRTFWVAVITAVIGLSAEPEIVALIRSPGSRVSSSPSAS